MIDRKNILLLGESEDYVLTIMKSSSDEHKGKFIVLYEDAFGEVDVHVMTPKAIINNYSIPKDELWEFINSLEENES